MEIYLFFNVFIILTRLNVMRKLSMSSFGVTFHAYLSYIIEASRSLIYGSSSSHVVQILCVCTTRTYTIEFANDSCQRESAVQTTQRFERRNDVEQNQLAHSRRQIAEYITWWSALTFRVPIAFTVSLLSVIVRTMVKQNDAVINNCAIIIHTSRSSNISWFYIQFFFEWNNLFFIIKME